MYFSEIEVLILAVNVHSLLSAKQLIKVMPVLTKFCTQEKGNNKKTRGSNALLAAKTQKAIQ